MAKNFIITLFISLNIVFILACASPKTSQYKSDKRNISEVFSLNSKAEIYTAKEIEGTNSFIIQKKSRHDSLQRNLKNPLEAYISDFQLTKNPNNRQEE